MMNNMTEGLLLIDIQNDYFEKGTMTLVNSDKACANAKRLLERFRSQMLPVIFIQHIAANPAATFFLPDTAGAEIHPSIQPIDGEKVIVKHFPNSFRGTELMDYLQTNNITDLVICGMMTHMCVDATTRAAKDLGFNITVIGDACATRNLEIKGEIVSAKDVHNSFLAALNYFYSTVKTTLQYLNID
jgi:nicotinamidase-related amidase